MPPVILPAPLAMLSRLPAAAIRFALALAFAAPGWAAPPRITVESLGAPLAPPLTAVAEAPSDPSVLYLGSEDGHVAVSRDGGRTWQTSALHTRRAPWLGGLRAATRRRPWRVQDSRGLVDFTLQPAFDFTGADPSDALSGVLFSTPLPPVSVSARNELAPLSVDAAIVEGLYEGVIGYDDPVPGARRGRGRGATARRLAGVVEARRPGGSPGFDRLAALTWREQPSSAVNALSVHPDDALDALAATADGLFHTRDGGISWDWVFGGASAEDAVIHHVVRDPRDPARVLLGTDAGVWESRDGAATFRAWMAPLVQGVAVWWIAQDPGDPNRLALATENGPLRSGDGGATVDWGFFAPWASAGWVRRVARDPHDARHVYSATTEGLWRSTDGGGLYEPLAPAIFGGQDVRLLRIGPEEGVLTVGTTTALWQSRDRGERWSLLPIDTGHWTLRWLEPSRNHPEMQYLLTAGELFRLAPSPAVGRVTTGGVRAAMARLARDPTLAETVAAASRNRGVYLPDVEAYRERSRWKAWVPTVRAGAFWRDSPLDVDRTFLVLGETTQINTFQFQRFGVVALAIWDVGALVYGDAESPVERSARLHRDAEAVLRASVTYLYRERQRLLLASETEPGDDQARLLRDLRIEELTAHLNALAGDLFTPRPAWPLRRPD